VHEDITDQCRADAQILHLSRNDDLTADRVVIDEHLRAALSRAARGERFALLFLEVDTFKAFNDRFGSPIGDDQLRQVARMSCRSRPFHSMRATGQRSIMRLCVRELAKRVGLSALGQKRTCQVVDCVRGWKSRGRAGSPFLI